MTAVSRTAPGPSALAAALYALSASAGNWIIDPPASTLEHPPSKLDLPELSRQMTLHTRLRAVLLTGAA